MKTEKIKEVVLVQPAELETPWLEGRRSVTLVPPLPGWASSRDWALVQVLEWVTETPALLARIFQGKRVKTTQNFTYYYYDGWKWYDATTGKRGETADVSEFQLNRLLGVYLGKRLEAAARYNVTDVLPFYLQKAQIFDPRLRKKSYAEHFSHLNKLIDEKTLCGPG